MADSSRPGDGRQQSMDQRSDARCKEVLPNTQPKARKLPHPTGADQRPTAPIKLEQSSEHGLDDYSFTPSTVSNVTHSHQTLDRKLLSTPSTVDRIPCVTIGAAPTMEVSLRYDNRKQYRDQVPAMNSASANGLSMLQDHELFVVDTTGSRKYEAHLRSLGGTRGTRGTWRSRSASPRRIEEESFPSYGHRHRVSRPTSQIALDYEEKTDQEAAEMDRKYHQIQEYEEDKALVDQEAAEAETEYYRLKLEESIQKRDKFRAMVEQQKSRMSHLTPQGPNLLGEPSAMAIQQNPTIDPWRHANTNRPEPAHALFSNNHAAYNLHSGLPPMAAYQNSFIDPRRFTNTSRLEPSHTVHYNNHTGLNYWIPQNAFFQEVARNPWQGIPHQQGVAATNLNQVPQITAAPAYAKELDVFKDRILATLAKGCAPSSSGPQIPPRAIKHGLASPLSKNRMYAECYGGNRDKDLNLCLWVFNTKSKCPDGWSCGSRHDPLDEEELEWIRTNLLPHAHGGNEPWQWRRFLMDLWLNYITPVAPERSRFDLTQGV